MENTQLNSHQTARTMRYIDAATMQVLQCAYL
jgi:hypothetical protein